jgi:hypothetical protein
MKKFVTGLLAKMGRVALSHIGNVQVPFMVNETVQKISADPKYQENGRLLRFGYKAYSQSDEDGIIQEIFNRISTTNKYFVEIGAGNGLENNTLFLLLNGWQGLWVEGNIDYCKSIGNKFKFLLNNKVLKIKQSFIDAGNINETLSENLVPAEIDLLSIDIDGNDYHIFKSLKVTTPRVVIIEYNAKFRPPTLWVMKYNPNHMWDRTDYQGASLKSYERLFAERGYSLVGCSITGANAFFVRNDLLGDKFCSPFTAENHYEPARYWLMYGLISGHRPNFGEFESI